MFFINKLFFFIFMILRLPISTLFPYTTLFRSTRGPAGGRSRPRVVAPVHLAQPAGRGAPAPPPRSEEHTSELQSLTNLVCRLLLEKKKTIQQVRKKLHMTS